MSMKQKQPALDFHHAEAYVFVKKKNVILEWEGSLFGL